MSTDDDRVADWLVRWEDAVAANQLPPTLDELPPALQESAREGQRLLRGFARRAQDTSSIPAVPVDAAAFARPPDTPRYRFEVFLARGGMGEVWRGYDVLMERHVALKVLRTHIVRAREVKARFEKEARLVARLQHPLIVPVFDMGELADGRPFFVMKLIHGRTLADLLKSRATLAEDLPRWIGVFEQVCQAVGFAHERGLLHRDLKPSNVMLGEFGEVQVMDWGIAKALLAERSRPSRRPTGASRSLPAAYARTFSNDSETQAGQPKGTPAFMAPEQARGDVKRIGKASDVFGLGGILCVILTGQPPFTQAGDLAGAFARLERCGGDTALIDLATACLQPEPEARPADGTEVARRVARYRADVAERERQAAQELWVSQFTEQAKRATGEDMGTADVPAAADARARLRHHALAWLRTEVATQARRLSSGTPAEAAAARQVLELFRNLPALAGVRNPAALAYLPEPERQMWQTFWQEVDGLLQRPDPAR